MNSIETFHVETYRVWFKYDLEEPINVNISPFFEWNPLLGHLKGKFGITTGPIKILTKMNDCVTKGLKILLY